MPCVRCSLHALTLVVRGTDRASMATDVRSEALTTGPRGGDRKRREHADHDSTGIADGPAAPHLGA